MALRMSNAGSQLRSRNAALIPSKGVLLGAIDPAIVCCWQQVAKKKPSIEAGQCAHNEDSVRCCLEVVLVAYA